MSMKWLLALLLVLALAAGGAYYYFQLNPPERYSTNEVYLTRYVSVAIPGGGVYGYPPGTKLLLDPSRRAAPGTVAVTDGKRKMDVETDALTRNPKIAQELADADRQGQTQAIAGVAAVKAHVTKVEADAQMARARDIERLNAEQRGVNPAALTPTPTPARPSGPPRAVSDLQRVGGG